MLFIAVDDLRDWVGHLGGHPNAKTPNIDLCSLPKRKGLDGQSLKPLLQNPEEKWERPAVIAYGLNNHAVQTERWPYIHCDDGSQELYGHERDPNKWTNLASISKYSPLKSKLSKWLPSTKLEPKK